MAITSAMMENMKIPYFIWQILCATAETIFIYTLSFFLLFWGFLLPNRVSKTFLHQLFAFTFVCQVKSHFISLLLFSLVTPSGSENKACSYVSKVSCLFCCVFFNFCIFITSFVSFSINTIDIVILPNKTIGKVGVWVTNLARMQYNEMESFIFVSNPKRFDNECTV